MMLGGSIMTIFIVFLILVIAIGAGTIISTNKNRELEQVKVDKRIQIQNDLREKDFYISRNFLSDETGNGLYYDDESKKFAIINVSNEYSKTNPFSYSYKFIDSKDILESEILKDDVSVTKTSRGGQLGGAIIGGVLAGGVGAIIGGVTSTKSTTEKIKKLTLRITINNTSNPIQDVVFANFYNPQDGASSKIKEIISQIDNFHKLISVLIKQNDKEQVNEPILNSTADELKKLAQLKNDGILSEEEFNQQKQKLLSI